MKLSPEHSMKECKTGRIHSLESFGTVDGPGIRFVVFFQGCPMRCQYCHNPDTWEVHAGTEMTVQEILELYDKNRNFYKNGGITATGGEPLLQMDFLTELFTAAKKEGIHTCLDTSGIMYRRENQEDYDRLFAVTDLVLLDIKHSDSQGHIRLTKQKQDHILEFLHALEQANVPVVIRHVVVPGITDSETELRGLGRLIGALRNLKGLEVLPYHTMGAAKYESLGIEYSLKGLESMDKQEAKKARAIILDEIRRVRQGRRE